MKYFSVQYMLWGLCGYDDEYSINCVCPLSWGQTNDYIFGMVYDR